MKQLFLILSIVLNSICAHCIAQTQVVKKETAAATQTYEELAMLQSRMAHVRDLLWQTPYDWSRMATCNVGAVAQILLNKSDIGLNVLLFGNYYPTYIKDGESLVFIKHSQYTWKGAMCYPARNTTSTIPGQDAMGVVYELLNLGLTRQDIINLEYLSDSTICQRAGIDRTKPRYYMEKNNLIKYVGAWVDLIGERAAKLEN